MKVDPIHFAIEGPRGYIRPYSTLACGLDSEMPSGEADKLVRTISLTAVTCDWCKLALDKKKDEPVTHRQLDERVVSMTFNNATNQQIEAAIERGIEKGLAKISRDFAEAKQPLEYLVSQGVEKALQRASVKQNLIGIHKIAEDEIDAEFDRDFPDNDEERQEEIRQALRDVLAEAAPGQTGAGVGTTFVQNISSALTARDVYHSTREALQDHDEEIDEDWKETELSITQKGVAGVVTSDEYQELIKKLINVALDERDEKHRQERLAYEQAMERFFDPFNLLVPISKQRLRIADLGDPIEGSDHKPVDPIVQVPANTVVHFRKLYRQETACFLDSSGLASTQLRSRVTCEECKSEMK